MRHENQIQNHEKPVGAAEEDLDDPMGPALAEQAAAPAKKRRSEQGLGKQGTPTAPAISELQEAAADDELTAEDRETLRRFDGLVKELKEMDPAASEEGQMQQWLKDRFYVLVMFFFQDCQTPVNCQLS